MKKILSLFAAVLLVAFAANAVTTTVNPTNFKNNLRTAVTNASAGDVLELTDGIFYEEGNFDIKKDLTIKAAAGAHPVIANLYYFRVEGDAKVTFQGIEFDGAIYKNGESADVTGASDHCIRSYKAAGGNEEVTLEDCEFHGYKSYVIYTHSEARKWKSLVVRNCYFHNNVKHSIAATHEASGGSSCDEIIIENSTFAHTTGSYNAIHIADGNTTALSVDHCTFYNYGSSFISTAASVTDVAISNCIFANSSAKSTVPTTCASGTITNCLTNNTGDFTTGPTITGCITGDPKFKDPDNEDVSKIDFTLAGNSPAIDKGTDGKTLGAPRWWPLPTIAIAGTMNGWNTTANVMTPAEDRQTASVTIALDETYYEFKVVIDGNWFALNGNGDLYTLHRDWNKVSDLQQETGNFILKPDEVPANYTFKWTYATGELEVIFPEKQVEPLEAPDAAPAAPEVSAELVEAVYSATYSADCNFGEWGSGTTYTQEDFGKKFVTNNNGYFGLEFNGKNCSKMEKLHLDVWIAEDASIRIVPIHGGTEVGVTKNLEGQKWNSIDIALSEFEGVANWSNVYQIKIDNAKNLTFWVNNVYFYATEAPAITLEDGYYIIGLHGWKIYNIEDADKFEAGETEGEFKLVTDLKDGDQFKVVAVAEKAITTWFPAEGDNYAVNAAHAGEGKTIYFRPNYNGNEDWHAACIFVPENVGPVNPFTSWFNEGDSKLEYDFENEVATVKIAADKGGQWMAQAKYQGPSSEKDKFYHIGLKLKANHAVSGITLKWEDNTGVIWKDQSIAIEEGVEFVFDEPSVQATVAGGNGVLVLDFGHAKAGDEIQIYGIVIEEVEAPSVELEDGYYLIGLNGWTVYDIAAADKFVENTEAEGEWLLADVTLEQGKKFKVVSVKDKAIETWYGSKDGNDYEVTADVAGVKTIYFRPEYTEAWAGYIYVQLNEVEPTLYCNLATGHLGDANFADVNGRILLTIKRAADFSLIVSIRNNNANGNPQTGLNYMWVSATGATNNNATYGSHDIDNSEEISVKVKFDAAQDSYHFNNIHWAYAGFGGEWAIDGLDVLASELCEDGVTTSIDSNIVAPKVLKMIENGQLIIIRDGIRYNAQGLIVR